MASALVGATALASTVSSATAKSKVQIPTSRHNVSSFPGFCTLPMRVHRASSSSIKATMTQNVDISKVVPQADRVLIRLEELPEKSAGGVLLPKSAVKFEHYLMGQVLSVGSEVGNIETGKQVMFSDINAYEVNLGTPEKHCFCRAGDLLAVVE